MAQYDFLKYLFIWQDWILPGACELSCPVAHTILVPGPRTESVSSALERRFLTTGPSGEPLILVLNDSFRLLFKDWNPWGGVGR